MSAPSGHYPPNPTRSVSVQQYSGSPLTTVRLNPVLVSWTAAQATATSTTAVHAAFNGSLSDQTVTTSITNPSCPRNLTVTAGGTSGDVKGSTVTITGTDIDGNSITEDFTLTVNTAETLTGSKAFKTVTSIALPAQDGTGMTLAVGVGSKLGLPYLCSRNCVLDAVLAGVREATFPTVAYSSSALSGNTVTLNSSLNGTAVDVLLAL